VHAGPYLLVRHVHIVVAKGHCYGEAAARVYPPKQDVGSSIARLLARHGHAHYGGDSVRPRQQDGAGVNDNHDNVLAHGSDGINQGVLFGGEREADAVGASVVFAWKSAVMA
jgi:hypothetical protein